MRDKQIVEMANAKKCETCIHNEVCEELEEFRDPLGWISTEDEFVCSYYNNAGYRKASDVAREIFEEIEKLMNKLDKRHIACGNPKQAWGVRSAMIELAELKKKYESEGEG